IVFFHIFIRSEIFTSASDPDLALAARLAALSVTDLLSLLSLSPNINAPRITRAASDVTIHFFLTVGTKIKISIKELINTAAPDNHAERVCDSINAMAAATNAIAANIFH